MKSRGRLLLGGLLLAAAQAHAHGPQLMPLVNVPIPPVPGLLDGTDPIVVNQQKAIQLGKALFWDANVGSDGMACGSCHFHAGADRRTKNQLNPGAKSSNPTGQTFDALASGASSGGPNYTLTLADFPRFDYNDPFSKASGIKHSTDDVVASSGTFSGQFNGSSRFIDPNDDCGRSTDPVFHVGGTGTRRVEPRNAPTVINAIFNYRNFWDGRANNVFNGSSPWGDRDPNAGVWVKTNARTVNKVRLHLTNASLASLATGPALSDTEMSCRQRKWPDIGRKLLSRQPLQNQKVHNEDSVLGGLSLSTPGNLQNGLNTTYKQLVMQAFNPKYWAYAGTASNGGGAVFGKSPSGVPYSQMEANFSMFFGLALQLYEATLVSDQAPVDLTQRDPLTHSPTWQGLGYSQAKINTLLAAQISFVANHCNICHGGPTLSVAALALNSALVTPTPGATFGPSYAQIPYGPHALGEKAGAAYSGIGPVISVVTRDNMGSDGAPKLVDLGFANTGVADPSSDPGVGGVDDFGHPLSFADQYVQYLLGNNASLFDPGVNAVRVCDFIVPLSLDFPNYFDPQTFSTDDGLEIDGSREGSLRNQGCANRTYEADVNLVWFIPTVAAANTALAAAPERLAVAKQAVFKIPSLRNIELTGPYMHNGSMATLSQVLEFYGRRGNVDNPLKNFLVDSIALDSQATRDGLIELFKTFTDERVRYERAPFDHPEVTVPNGHPGDNQNATAGNPLNATLATDDYLVIPAVGASGSAQPLPSFDTFLTP
ncbi:MAG: cytochrome C peroxidase [Methylococcaceae bacterium]|nr:cytochrome C peroxidase [Methylococcaceae bacterium]